MCLVALFPQESFESSCDVELSLFGVFRTRRCAPLCKCSYNFQESFDFGYSVDLCFFSGMMRNRSALLCGRTGLQGEFLTPQRCLFFMFEIKRHASLCTGPVTLSRVSNSATVSSYACPMQEFCPFVYICMYVCPHMFKEW